MLEPGGDYYLQGRVHGRGFSKMEQLDGVADPGDVPFSFWRAHWHTAACAGLLNALARISGLLLCDMLTNHKGHGWFASVIEVASVCRVSGLSISCDLKQMRARCLAVVAVQICRGLNDTFADGWFSGMLRSHVVGRVGWALCSLSACAPVGLVQTVDDSC